MTATKHSPAHDDFFRGNLYATLEKTSSARLLISKGRDTERDMKELRLDFHPQEN
jgi:hypothetical protein